MRKIGSTLLVLGCGSTFLYLVGMEFYVLMWIENWGETVAWSIRIAIMVLGGVLFFMGGGIDADESESAEAD